MVQGDRNTNFIHLSTVIRRCRNHIDMLKNSEGGWVTDIKGLEKLVVEYFLDDVP